MWAARVEQGMDRLRSLRTQVGLQEEPSKAFAFRYAYLIWKDPLMGVGDDTYTADLIAWAGGRNVLSGGERYPALAADELEEKAPELVLLPDEPFPFAEKHLEAMQAVAPHSDLQLVGGDDFCWHGVRTVRGLQRAAELLARYGTET